MPDTHQPWRPPLSQSLLGAPHPDPHVGGELFLVGADQKEVGTLGSATDIHFTVMILTAEMRHPGMVAVILKSEKTLDG